MSVGFYGISVMTSFVAGVYAAQNYNLPNIKTWVDHGIQTLSALEKTLRKKT